MTSHNDVIMTHNMLEYIGKIDFQKHFVLIFCKMAPSQLTFDRILAAEGLKGTFQRWCILDADGEKT